jgi:hypothetical protein
MINFLRLVDVGMTVVLQNDPLGTALTDRLIINLE